MKKSTKGAIASAAAAVLLLGGGTSLAYWTASANVNGGSITAGDLKLVAGSCDANWVYAAGHASAGTAVSLWVPGDVVTKSCTFTISATGDNLKATLTSPSSVPLSATSAAGATSESATAAVVYTVAGSAVTDVDTGTSGIQIDDTSDGDTLTATFTVTFPYGTDQTGTPVVNGNDTQDWVAAFDALTVTLTQLDPNP